MKCFQGYTLIELLLAAAIVGILMAVGIPVYNHYLHAANRLDAYTALLNIQERQERWMTQFSQYTDTVSDLGSSTSPNHHYSIRIVHADILSDSPDCTSLIPSRSVNKQIYIVTAIPKTGSPQIKDTDCSCIYLTNTGLKGSTGNRVKPLDCW